MKFATAFFDFVLAVFPDGERSQSPFFFAKIIDFTDKLFTKLYCTLCERLFFFFFFLKNRILLSKLILVRNLFFYSIQEKFDRFFFSHYLSPLTKSTSFLINSSFRE